MSIYYIEFEINGKQELFSFDCTSSVTLEDNGDATSFPLESGNSVSDSYVNKNIMVRMSGLISDIKTRTVSGSSFNKTTQDFISKLRKLKSDGLPFKLYLGSNLGSVDNCVFESLEFDVNQAKLVANKEIGSFRISFTAKQIRLGSRAQLVIVRDTVIFRTTAPERPDSGTTQELSDQKQITLEGVTQNQRYIKGGF